MNERPRTIDGGMLVGGMILIAIGIAFLLDQLEVPDIGRVISYYWPLAVVAIGLSKLFDVQTMWFGLTAMVVGGWLQAVRLHWHDLTFSNSWPLLLMVLGGGIVLRTFIDPLTRRLDGANHGSQE